ncbi:MAG: hypothetical protein QOJ20_1987 [Mycobacterium sp.]|jgi:hypothetical protein|nr:hypothetical protein [Mycobacterium sp.]
MLLASDTRVPINLYIEAYPDPDEARGDWDAIKQLAADDVIKVDGLVLVSLGCDHAEKVTKHEVDRDNANQVETAVNPPPS